MTWTVHTDENLCANVQAGCLGADDGINSKKAPPPPPVRRALGTDFGRHASPGLRVRQESIGSTSELSIESRIPFIAPSTEELQRRYMEKKRQELAELRKKNERSCYDAIHFPDIAGSGGSILHNHRSQQITVPREFNLSVTSRSNRSVSSNMDADAGSDGERSNWSSSLRGSQRAGRSSSRNWRPALIVPDGPSLRTAVRVSSRSLSRQGSERSFRGTAIREDAPTPARSCRSDMSLITPSPAASSVAGSHRSGRGRSAGARALLSGSMRSHQGQISTRQLTVPPSPARSHDCSIRSNSDMSIASMGSRMSRLSVRSSSSRCGPSTEERQLSQARIGRLELKNLMEHNARNYRVGLVNPDVYSVRSSDQFTVPQDFNLSRSNLPACRSRSGSVCSRSDAGSVRSGRSGKPRQPSARRTDWKPQLTVPKGPFLETAERARSSSSRRSRMENSVTRSVSASRSSNVPVREQEAIERHLDNKDRAMKGDAATGRVDRPRSRPACNRSSQRVELPAGCDDLQQWVREAANVEERAERARAVACIQHEEGLADQNRRVCVFKTNGGPTCGAAPRTPRAGDDYSR